MEDHRNEDSISQSILRRITGMYSRLSVVETRIADYVVAHPFAAIRSSTEELASTCEVSTASITRFCQKLGCTGFKELKIILAQEIGSLAPRMPSESGPGEHSNYVSQVLHQSIDGMERTVSALDKDILDAAIQAIADARFVDIYGAGESHVIGESLQMKLRRLGVAANLHSNPSLQIMSTASLGPGDVGIGISLSGCTQDTVDAVAFAAERGATTIAITNFPEFPLAEKADIVLRTNTIETIFPHSSIAARQAQHLIVDVLVVGLLIDYRERFLEPYEYYSSVITKKRR